MHPEGQLEHLTGLVQPASRKEDDVVTLGVAIAALILFVGTTGALMPKIVRSAMGLGAAPDLLLTNAVLLNIALLLFGWRRYAALQREVKIRREAETVARELALRDPLTQCLNRRSGLPALQEACRSACASGRDLAVLMIDLDNFKQINDVRGHLQGDRVLAEIARRMAHQQPANGVLARIGGDEFACCFSFTPGDVDDVERFASRLINAVSLPILIDEVSVQSSVSIGIALWRQEDEGRGDRPTSPCITRKSAAGTVIAGSIRRWNRRCACAASLNPAFATGSSRMNSFRSIRSRSTCAPAS